MKETKSFDRTHALFALVPFLIIMLVPLVMAVMGYRDYVSELLSDTVAVTEFLQELALYAACTLLCVVIGLPGAYIMARLRFPLKGLIWSLCLLSLASPPSAVALAVFRLRAMTGLSLPKPFLWDAIVLLIANIPLVVLIVGVYWKSFDESLIESAATLGIGRARVFFTVVLPYLSRAICCSAALVLLRCLTESLSSPPLAFLASLLAVAVISGTLYGRHAPSMCTARLGEVKASGFGPHLLVILYCLLLLAITLSSPSVLIYEALTSDAGLTISGYRNLFLFEASKGNVALLILATIIIPSSLIATLLALGISHAVKVLRFPALIALIPLSMGFDMTISGYSAVHPLLPEVPLFVFEIIANIAYLTPIALLTLLPLSRSIDPSLRPASQTLGYGAGRSYRKTEGRLLRPAYVAAVLITIAICTVKYTPFLLSDLLDMATINNTYIKDASALASMMTVFCFILLLAGSRLLRKKA